MMNLDYPQKYDKSTVKCISFLAHNPLYCVHLLSRYYPFSLKLLLEYADVLNWCLVSCNTNIKWDFDLIYAVYDKISWKDLSVNTAAFKDLSLLSIFSEEIYWTNKPDGHGFTPANNEGIPWTFELIKKYESKIDFKHLSYNKSVEWSEELIDRYLDKWDLEDLGDNDAVPWDLRLFEKYLGEEYIGEELLCDYFRLLGNVDLVEKYKHSISWLQVCSNPYLPWFEKNLFVYWADHINWLGICANRSLFKQDPAFFVKHLDIWESHIKYIYYLSENPSLPWSKTLLKKYSRFWDWEAISCNEGIPWTTDLIDAFADKLQWGGLVHMFITEDEIGKPIPPIPITSYKKGLISNSSLPWSIDFLINYESKLNLSPGRDSPEIWNKVFKPVIDDKVLGVLMRLV